ncbi:glutamine-hydrolyzing GMP synthase [Rubellicoccus peritrichatus]|uniref:GMP synthase [glutamine-hydrolyzing] n=1 Tax=Rubellicoccus peritrichatus TaxID=3080537 RepID=A0AAQ3LDS2_9BACT|nr:glutamine-hydrolyzing GMP synthase [Puniceicoccus sp. CR14]WOO43512.1 glutamine-hydrolyzing GMP synthase [Puniceicoccus sp. CR14]
MSQTIAVLDFGSQYTQVIARRIRECNIYSRIFPYSVTAAELRKANVSGIILSGGPSSVLTKGSPRPDKKIFQLGVPVLGICYGLQLMGKLLGGDVAKSDRREYGRGRLTIKKKGRLLKGLPKSIKVWNSHGDKVTALPEGFEPIAGTENSDYAVIEDATRNFYGLQFHPEVVHSERGDDIIKNFLVGVCKCKQDWKMSNYVDQAIQDIRDQVGDSRVILGLSGGVDSSVAAALIHRAIGDQLTCVFVDNGLLRLRERDRVEQVFRDHFHVDLRVAKSGKRFLKALKGVTDPERKRKIIGKIFVDVFEDTVKKIGDVDFLAQGTLYPDVIESVAIDGNPAALIKSHHNVGGLPKRMKLKLLEPFRELFKDEVRALGKELGLPDEMIWRHPFPGPGLGVRVMGEIKKSYLDTLREADAILLEEMKRTGYYSKVWQAFCVFLPVQTVGVMGDERTYDYVIALRVVESVDAMTADWAHIPHDILQIISNRIINEVKGVNRVVLDISSKPPSTIEWE